MQSLSIRTRIRVFQAIVAAAVLLMAAAGFGAIRGVQYYFNRGALSHEQLEAITRLAVHANRYSEQIAELLLVGEPERPDLESAQRELEAGFDSLERFTAREAEFLGIAGDREESRIEFERLERMRQLYAEMNKQIDALFAMREAGKQDEAVREFRREIENWLDAEFEKVIAAAVADEIGEVEVADREAEQMTGLLTKLIGATIAISLAGTLAAGYFLHGAIVPPIERLSAGAMAIGRGDLSFRVGQIGNDELGMLAKRFDEMAEQLKNQQSLLLAGQSHLEAQVRTRTAELEEANVQLKHLDRSRVGFLADISHELRTPLTVLRGEAEVTLRDKDPRLESYRDTLSRIVEQARDMSRLVDDLMFLARSETDDVRFEQDELELADIVLESVGEIQTLSRARGIQIATNLPSDNVVIAGDRQRMKQLFLIILDNAVKYAPPHSAVIVALAADRDSAILRIRNRGGISGEDLPRLFERFYRGRDPAARSTGGSGLGLAIARWIVEKQGGSITLSTEPDGWVEVKIVFPPAREVASASRALA